MSLWAATLPLDQDPPFIDADDLHDMIDDIEDGAIPWQCFTVRYQGDIPASNPPPWMTQDFEIWFRCPRMVLHNMLGNPDFANEMDFAPKRVYNKEGKREYKDFMSGDWAWKQSVRLALAI